ncbi:MAG TPA: ROK family transcriptional regulator, partial [Myxococcales bacterium]
MTGNQSLLKRINRTALLRLVKAEPGLSRVELAHRTGLTKAAVGLLVQELIDEGWLCQSEPSAAQGVGRRPGPLALDGRRVGLLGAEVGVDYLDAVACDLQGERLWSRRVRYPPRDVGRTVRRLGALVASAQAALRAEGRRALGLGVGVPGAVDARDGTLRFAPNLGWHDVELLPQLRAALPAAGCGELPVQLLNEANAAALSEYVFGEAPPAGPLVYLSMGIGLGAGVVLGDRLYLGHGGLAGEVGHTILDRSDPPCACGRRGCAEAFVSQRAVSRSVTGRDHPVLAIEELSARLARREPAAVRGATQAGEYLGILLQNIANSFDPALVVLGGPLCQLGDVFVKRALRAMAAHAGQYDRERPSVQLCRFGVDACAVGAAASVFQDFLTALPGAAAPRGARRAAP